jgi:hypothetical protein
MKGLLLMLDDVAQRLAILNLDNDGTREPGKVIFYDFGNREKVHTHTHTHGKYYASAGV